MNQDYNAVKGVCEDLCPKSEVELRTHNNIIHYFEKRHNVFVKEFSRSAADKKLTSADNLRTFPAMEGTLDFLFTRIIIDESRPLNFRYDFIFDRCRALRQEIVIQNLSAGRTLRLVEPIVMFLSLSLYQLYGEPISTFDSTICRQHLNECLLSCLSCYDEIEEGMYNHQNRILIEGIYILLNLSEENSLRRALKLKLFIKSSRIMQTVFEIALNMHTRNHFRVINLIPKLPHVLCAIASLKLTEIRKEILKTFTIAYNSNNLRVSADFIQRVLKYERKEDLHRDLINLGICDDETENLTSINFNRKKFNIGNSCSHFSSSSINSKINLYEISDIILLRNIH